MNASILIADGEEAFRQNIKAHAHWNGFEVIEAKDPNTAFDLFKRKKPDIVIIGSFTTDPNNGLKLSKSIRRYDKKTPIILIARHSSEALAIAALRAGITDYYKMPLRFECLAESAKRILSEQREKFQEVSDCDIIGESVQMQEIKGYLTKVAAVDSTVLVTGETGTGKELVAELIHKKSPRHKKPFVCINCAALPENLIESEMFGYERGAFTGAVAAKKGKFAIASGGTFFLDEIGDMSPYAQAKVLRTIESKAVYPLGAQGAVPLDVRVIAATNQDPEKLMAEGSFRKDLYYRLNIARVHLPPIRERKEDIPHLVQHGIRNLNRRFHREVEGLTDEAMACLFRYDWPGNVRELLNLLEATYVNLPAKPIAYIDLPEKIQNQLKGAEGSPNEERKQIVAALLETKWNKSTAAQKLHWSRMTLYRKIEKYHIVEKRSSAR